MTVLLAACAPAAPAPEIAALEPIVEIDWPDGTTLTPFENLEGLILFGAHLRSGNGADTAGILAFDSGAGYLALDHELAWRFGLTSDRKAPEDINVMRQPLQRLSIGALQMDYITPLISFRGEIIQRVTDRDVIGLLGQRPLTGRAIWIDYEEEQLAIVPVPQTGRGKRPNDRSRVAASREVFGEIASPSAMAMAFQLESDGKIVMRGRVSDPAPPRYSSDLTLIVDTGATWCVLSEKVLQRYVEHEKNWETLEGYSAPTLFGDMTARVSRIPRFQLRADGINAELDDVDTAILGDDLFQLISRALGRHIDGLVGYTFLKEYRVGIDYVNEVLWLDPKLKGWEQRPYRDSHIGVQLHRIAGDIRIEAVLEGSPAQEVGLKVGDTIVAVDGRSASEFDLERMLHYFEDRPGSQVDVTVRRGDRERQYMIVRRNLF